MFNLAHLIRLMNDGKSYRSIAESLNLSLTTVQNYANLFKSHKINLSEFRLKSNVELHDFIQLLPKALNERMQDFLVVFKEYEFKLLSKSMSRKEIYDEYLKSAKDALCYSQFCTLIGVELKTKDIYMHFDHKPGDKMFIDFAGDKLYYIDPVTKIKVVVEIFVAILGHSQKTYVEAIASQKIEDFLPAIERAIIYFGGVPQAIVPDNLKSAVTKASKYEAVINESFQHLCEHYDCFPFPARPHEPHDKSLAENAVGKSYQYIYKQVKKTEHHSISEINQAIFINLELFNCKNFSQRDYSRNDLFEQNEKKCLKSLPLKRYEIVRFLKAKVRLNYHIWFSVDKHNYSVPYQYAGKNTKIIYNSDTIEIFCDYKRIATHKRDLTRYGYTTNNEHLSPSHKFVADQSPENLSRDAEKIGPFTCQIITKILDSKNYQDQKIKSGKGILSLAKKIGNDVMELCCKRAIGFDVANYQQIKNIADKKLFLETEITPPPCKAIDSHQNQRGKEYYAQKAVMV